MAKTDDDTGFREKRLIFGQKLAKVAKNCDHNIDCARVSTELYLIFIIYFFG
jgi:hypothetical protein